MELNPTMTEHSNQEKSKEPAKQLPKNEFIAFMNEFVGESDRAAVILGAAQIDRQLQTILSQRLLPSPDSPDDLLEGDSPLGTFSARIRACQRLGLIDDQFAKLLHVLRKLRNVFAHDVGHSSLSNSSEKNRVHALTEPIRQAPYFQRAVKLVSEEMQKPPDGIGVQFRAVLAVFTIELGAISKATTGLTRLSSESFVERVFRAKNANGGKPVTTEDAKKLV